MTLLRTCFGGYPLPHVPSASWPHQFDGVIRATMLIVLCLLAASCAGTQPASLDFSGGCPPASSPYLKHDVMVSQGRISYCDSGDAATGVIESTLFSPGTRVLEFLVAGYPDEPGIRLEVVSIDGTSAVDVPVTRVGDRWQPVRFEVPTKLQATAFRLRLVDESKTSFGWAGLGQPRPITVWSIAKAVASVITVLAAGHLWLLLAALAFPRGWSPAARAAGGFSALGVTAYLVFLAYVVAPVWGHKLAFAWLTAPIAVAIARHRSREAWRDTALLNRILVPAALLAGLILWIGLYPLSWTGDDWSMPAKRWRDMPMDNWLPLLFAQMVATGEMTRPMIGDWLSSDRPPLQAGLYLLFNPILPGTPGFSYQVLSTWAQTLLLVPLGLLIPPALKRVDRALCMLVIGLSALIVLNALFVWPKLLAAGYCAIYHMLLFRPKDASRHPLTGAAAGLVAALALLSHGGAFFALAGSSIALMLMKRLGAVKPLLFAAITCVTAYLPWMLYQRLLDPPGDRLLKWHFAGQIVPVETSFGDVLANAYASVSMAQWLADRKTNLVTLFDGALRFFADAVTLLPGAPVAAERAMIQTSFFSTAYSLWLFSPLLIPPLLAVTWLRRGVAHVAAPPGLATATAAGLLLWVLLMFSPASTIVHQGGYFTFIALELLVMLLAVSASPWLFRALAVGNIAVFLALYAFDRPMTRLPFPAAYALGTAALVVALFAAVRSALRTSDTPLLSKETA